MLPVRAMLPMLLINASQTRLLDSPRVSTFRIIHYSRDRVRCKPELEFGHASTLFLYTTAIVGLSLRRHNLLKIFEIFYRYHSNQHSYLPARLSMNKSSVSLSVFTFPCDVERLIFEQAALSDRKTNVQLITVSKRAQAW